MKANLSLILNAVGLAMAVATVVLLILKASTPENAAMLLGIGLFCIALDALQRTRQAENPPARKPVPSGSGKPAPSSSKRKK